MFGQNTEIVNI